MRPTWSTSTNIMGIGKSLLCCNLIAIWILLTAIDRPAYAELGALRQQWPNIPILALTGTCTLEIRDSIADLLHFQRPLTHSFGKHKESLFDINHAHALQMQQKWVQCCSLLPCTGPTSRFMSSHLARKRKMLIKRSRQRLSSSLILPRMQPKVGSSSLGMLT
jgi:hypothetical protein